MKAFILDDEPSAVNTLVLLLQRYAPEITDISTSSDAANALERIQSFSPDILFLDVQMPVVNGFELLTRFPEISFDVIFTTAYDQYAIQAIRFSALDYLLKPIDANELQEAVSRFLLKRSRQNKGKELLNNLLHNIRSAESHFTLAIATTEGTFFFKPDEIIRLEAESSYTRFFFSSRKPLLTSKTLKEYEEILTSHGFIRTHKSHLVNHKCIEHIDSEGYAALSDGSRIEISRRRRSDVLKALGKR